MKTTGKCCATANILVSLLAVYFVYLMVKLNETTSYHHGCGATVQYDGETLSLLSHRSSAILSNQNVS